MRTMRRRVGFSLRGPRVRPRAVTVDEGCNHHWIIDPPDGPISRGVCKICGVHREFQNAWTFKGNW